MHAAPQIRASITAHERLRRRRVFLNRRREAALFGAILALWALLMLVGVGGAG